MTFTRKTQLQNYFLMEQQSHRAVYLEFYRQMAPTRDLGKLYDPENPLYEDFLYEITRKQKRR